jgi:hypothetical protein
MKKYAIGFISLLFTISVYSQEVISSQGETYTNSNGSIDFTLGEVVINTGTDGNNDLTQGFHQTKWNFLGVEDFVLDYEATIFPNPTAEVLIVKSRAFQNVTYSLYDAQGKLVIHAKLSAEQTPIQIGQFAPGGYSLNLSNEKQLLKTFKLIKSY